MIKSNRFRHLRGEIFYRSSRDSHRMPGMTTRLVARVELSE